MNAEERGNVLVASMGQLAVTFAQLTGRSLVVRIETSDGAVLDVAEALGVIRSGKDVFREPGSGNIGITVNLEHGSSFHLVGAPKKEKANA